LVVSWSLELEDGSLYSLGDVATDPLDLDLRVLRSDRQVLATVDARCRGACWSIDGIAQLSNAELQVQGEAAVSPLD
jgi:hypothetical protein